MPRPKKTEAQLNEMRQQILDAAYTNLVERGTEGLTSRAIAERLGLAHMALFTYFPNQAAILQALSEREMVRFQAKQEVFEQRAKHEDILHVVEDALAFFPNFEKENPRVFHLAWVLPMEGFENPEHARLRMQSNVKHMARLIQIGMEQGIFEDRDPSIAAAAAISMVITPPILYHSGRIPTPELRDRLVQEMLIAALRYLRKG